ncbi:hypothetical protein PtB15_7B230 [Puccinia triticina]|nr:hypothetical protein PtB15_7B230 [Puccinia triticina]
MEITFLKKFCEVGNLKALLDIEQLPPSMQPFIQQLKSYYDPIPFTPVTNHRRYDDSLDDQLYHNLIHKINDKFPLYGNVWITSTDYSAKEVTDRSNYTPVTSRANFLKHHSIRSEVYSTFHVSQNNSIVRLKDLSKATCRIDSIFRHARIGPDDEIYKDVFFAIKPLKAVPPITSNPFRQLADYEMQVSLQMFHPETHAMVIHESEILSHCAWIKFKPGEISHDISFETIAKLEH